MGWASGTELLDTIWRIISLEIEPDARTSVAIKLCNLFQDYDCDTYRDTNAYVIAMRDVNYFINDITLGGIYHFNSAKEVFIEAKKRQLILTKEIRDSVYDFYSKRDLLIGKSDG